MARPNVTFNCAVSLDGKIGPPDRTHVSIGSAEDRRRMSDRRAAADAVVVGGRTFRAAPQALIEDGNSGWGPRSTPVLNVVLSRTLDLPLEGPAFHDPRVKWLVFTGPDAPPAKVLAVSRVAEVVALPAVEPKAVLENLEARGVERVLLEAGGEVASLFFHADAIDEVYLTIVPLVLGGRNAPSPVDGEAWPVGQWPRLKLHHAQPVGDEVFLHYRRS